MYILVSVSASASAPAAAWHAHWKYTETHRTVLIYRYGSPAPRRTLKYLLCTIYTEVLHWSITLYCLQSVFTECIYTLPFTACRRIFPTRACVCVSSIHSQQSLSTSPACHSQISTFDSGNSVGSQWELTVSSQWALSSVTREEDWLSGLTGLNIDSTCATCRHKQLHHNYTHVWPDGWPLSTELSQSWLGVLL